jgi:secondary thiamine-phosphate synthase enzyme
MLETVKVRTPGRDAMIDVTDQVRRVVTRSGIAEGVCHVLVAHTTAGITINERADPGVPNDILRWLDEVVPWQHDWEHMEPNTASHIKAALFGNSATLIVHQGQLVLGTWQAVFVCEFDGPRERTFHVKVMAG